VCAPTAIEDDWIPDTSGIPYAEEDEVLTDD